MRPALTVLSDQEANRILQEAVSVLEEPGVIINHQGALKMLAEAGARIDPQKNLACLPEGVISSALSSCPAKFSLYDLNGTEALRYGDKQTYFNPGSSALTVLDSRTKTIRPVNTGDFTRFVQLVEMLPALNAQSTAMVCSDVPESIQDLYRLYVSLNYQTKPIVTGVFQSQNWTVMREMLETALGGSQKLRDRPAAIFDICPTSPLQWSFTSCQNLLDNVQAGIPVQIIPMPLTGATAPVTLGGALVQHTAECLSGVVLSQLASQGARLVWGGSAAVFDMRYGQASLAAPGTWLLACAYAKIGQTLSLPTQGYLGLSDAKVLDAQAGMESAVGAQLGILAGFDMISGAGLLAHENCQSPEKLVLDAEMLAQLQHFAAGIQLRDHPVGLNLIREVGHQGDFISHDHTYRWFRKETHYPSPLLDRQSAADWLHQGSQDAWQRARAQVNLLLKDYPGPALDGPTRNELRGIASRAAQLSGLDQLPELPG